tara:strand:+ start:2586 stop:2786 length:201 start_codon:yes stop_codon:yes gene_type:complete
VLFGTGIKNQQQLIIMKYSVTYLKNKKNKKAKQTAVFYTIEDAVMWENHVRSQNCENIEIIPIFSE